MRCDMGYTPMMQQYIETKKLYQDCILFYRLGDFYEMFFEDAIEASKAIEIALTGKNCGMEEKAPMCGVPYHAAENYIAKLVNKGYKVAICEQVEDPKLAKGIVKREVVRIVTPGTVTSASMLNEGENSYIASVSETEDGIGFAYADLTTGEVCCREFTTSDIEALRNEIVRIAAKEIIISSDYRTTRAAEIIQEDTDCCLSDVNPHYYDYKPAENSIKRQFGVESLEGLGIAEMKMAIISLGALLQYLLETQKQSLSHIIKLTVNNDASNMSLDRTTLRNLELTETIFERSVDGSLFGVLDKTGTAMGSRRMKQWLRAPLNNPVEINRRLDGVEYFADNFLSRNDIREELKNIYDLERLSGRIACGNANPRDMIALKRSVASLPSIKNEIANTETEILTDLESRISDLSEVFRLIDDAILEEPSFSVKDGGIIKEGYSEKLDSLKLSIKDGREWIAGLEAAEKERSGIKTLKVGFNKVFGYYIEVSKAAAANVPADYIRKQTLVNNERFITPELKEVESVVLGAETKINNLEYSIFNDIRNKLTEHIEELQETASALADLDVLTAFAEVSSVNGYVKPTVNNGDTITIVKGRHPVIENSIKNGSFVSNDLYIDNEASSLLLITGPNMAGKSTYMRQNAIIVLMAQTGCFVPCERAVIGAVDRIYTRIGASDNLSRGQSTFYVEMSELACILNTATEKSLIILDEIGRGTSTYDGLSIAWSVVEHLTAKKKIKTMFATHYHELTVLEKSIRGVKNLNVDVREEAGNVVFLHKIIEGHANQSYGIHVAKIAGVPQEVLDRAEQRLAELENESIAIAGLNKYDESTIVDSVPEAVPADTSIKNNYENKSKSEAQDQLSIFDFMSNPVAEKLRNLDLMNITPSQAIRILEELKDLC